MSQKDPWGNDVGIGNSSTGNPLQQISNNLTRLDENVKKLEQNLQNLGTKNDNKQLRNTWNDIRNNSKQLINQTKVLFTQVPESEMNKKTTAMGTFKEIVQRYENASQKAMKREKEIMEVLQISLTNESEATKKREQLQIELIEVDQGIVNQRNEDIKLLVADLQDLNTLQTQINQRVLEDREKINQVSTNTQQASNNIETGKKELEKTSEYVCGIRKKTFFIIIIVIAIIVVIGLIIGLSVGLTIGKSPTPPSPGTPSSTPSSTPS